MKRFLGFSFVLSFLLLLARVSQSQPENDDLIYQEAMTVYLGNLARRDNGVPPLRWNRQLTEAGRWFSWDSVENRPEPYCGHQDTQGNWPDYRARTFGYLGFAGAENAFCGYVTPQQAIDGWMNSPGHRANLLAPNSREVGLGYFRRLSDSRGYVTQDFGADPVFPPVVIDNEAINTTDTAVDLYIYDRASGGGFAELGPATQMMVSNEPCFINTNWESFATAKSWTLISGSGWRQVYVKTQDTLSRTTTVSDTIYLGPSVPLAELSLDQASTTRDTVTLYDLDGNGMSHMQFSLNWLADDTFPTFNLNWGNGERVNDSAAWGGTAYRLRSGNGESNAWVWTTEFVKEEPLVAYLRLKVNDNNSPNEVARFAINGGGVPYGPISLKGSDFNAADQYQEFALPFTFHDDPNDVFLIFNFYRSGSADVYVDAVSIFTTAAPVVSPTEWVAPGGNYRGQGVWVRFTDGGVNFSARSEASLHPSQFTVSPGMLLFAAPEDGPATSIQTLSVAGCGITAWQVSAGVGWLHWEIVGDTVRVWADPAGLSPGRYSGTLTIAAPGETAVPIAVTHMVLEPRIYLPVTLKE